MTFYFSCLGKMKATIQLTGVLYNPVQNGSLWSLGELIYFGKVRRRYLQSSTISFSFLKIKNEVSLNKRLKLKILIYFTLLNLIFKSQDTF